MIVFTINNNKNDNNVLNNKKIIHCVGRRIKIFLRLKADGKIVVIDTSIASFAKVLCVHKS